MVFTMLTRSAVAKLLRRSIATVRRLEGQELFPRRDRSGVLRFDEGEVAAVVRRLRAGDVTAARGDWLDVRRRRPQAWSLIGARKGSSAGVEHSEEIARLREENARLRAELADVMTASGELLEEIEALCND
jgi:hypothetical protein